jgi:acid phosphatase
MLGLASCGGTSVAGDSHPARGTGDRSLAAIQHIVVIYAENRSFDNLFGLFPGADGIANATPDSYVQRDRDGRVLEVLPPVWNGKPPQPDPAYPRRIANRPFRIDDPNGVNRPLSMPTRDLVHRFYQHQEQIDGGKLDKFAALSDAGGLTMGYYDGAGLAKWKIAQEFTLADHFFMGAFGGSFSNHFWLVCACTPEFRDAPEDMRAKLDAAGHLLRKQTSPPSALDGPPELADGSVTPDGYAVNTVQPPYQPSGLPPAPNGDNRFADPSKHPLPPQHAKTIGDTLSAAGVSWAWYAGAWDAALADGIQAPSVARTVIYNAAEGSPNFQPHHQPFNYFAKYAPGTRERAEHLKDGNEFLGAIERGTLPAVAFYKPQGNLNEHPGYTDVLSGDAHIAELVRKIQASPLWPSTVVIVTYDENGGFWDHVPPPAGDRWGPGSRIPTIIISPFARRNYVDHSSYDTTSILKFITRRFGLEPLSGVRSNAGDLTNALELGAPHGN